MPAEIPGTYVFETPGEVFLEVEIPSGRVVVATVENARTTVDLVALGRGADPLGDILVTCEDRDGGRHRVRIERKDRIKWGPLSISWGAEVEVRITCPPGSRLELTGGSTDLDVDGELGQVSARTASGDVSLAAVSGELEVKTASGDVHVGRISAEARIATTSGDLELERVAGPVTARSVSGDATVWSLASPLTISTTSGDIGVRRVDAGELRAQTVSGDVEVGVAAGTSVWIDATSVSGDLASELGIHDDEPPDAAETAVVALHVKTVSGDVRIVRSAETLSA
jgi:DUF4097 and DUF4098 domain-containing protein YvlB